MQASRKRPPLALAVDSSSGSDDSRRLIAAIRQRQSQANDQTQADDWVEWLPAWVPEWLPEWLRGRRTLAACCVLLIALSPRLAVLLLLIAAAFVAGYIVAVPVTSKAPSLPPRSRPLILDHYDDEKTPVSERGPQISLPTEIDTALTKFLDLFIRDFIDNWYKPINYSGSSEFPSAVNSSMRHGFLTLGMKAGSMNATAAVVPISQTFISHIREYRRFEQSLLPLPDYLAQNPGSIYQRYHDTTDHTQSEVPRSSAATNSAQLRRLSAHIALSTLPRADRSSPVVFSFIREMVATSILASAVDRFSDPDYINLAIVDYCKGLIAKADSDAVAASGVSAENGGEEVRTVSSFPTKVSRRVTDDPDADQLYVKVVEGRRLPAGGANLFCGVIVGGEILKTRKVPGEACPSWSEDFQFEIGRGVDGITVDIYEARLLRDDLFGTVAIPLASIHPNKFTKIWFPIDTSDSRMHRAAQAQTAELLLELIIVSTNGDTIESPTTTTTQPHTTTTPRTPLSSSRSQISLTSVLDGPGMDDLLVEFMQHLDSVNESVQLQLYLMIVAFRQGDAGASEARSLHDTFFGQEAQMRVVVDSGVVERVENRLASGGFGKEVFDEVKAAVLKNLDGFWREFCKTESFKSYVRATGLVLAGEEIIDAAEQKMKSVEAPPPAVPFRPPVQDADAPPPKPPRAIHAAVEPIPTLPSSESEPVVVAPVKPPRDAFSTVPRQPPTPPRPQKKFPPAENNPLRSLEALSDPVEVDAKVDSTAQNEDRDNSVPIEESATTTTQLTLLEDAAADKIEPATEDAFSEDERLRMEDEDRLLALALQSADDEDDPTSIQTLPNPETNQSTTTALMNEIASLRERISVVDAALESSQSPTTTTTTRSRKLMDEKQELIHQLSVLMDMIAEAETDDVGDPMSLADTGVRVVDLDDGLFAVEVERRDGSAGWMVTHPYSDFATLYDALREAFPKVAHTRFLMMPPGSNAFGWGRTALSPFEGRARVGRELEGWLNVMLSDGVVVESRHLQEFLMPENLRRSSVGRREIWRPRSSSSLSSSEKMGGGSGAAGSLRQMFGALKTAGRVVKNAAVSTGNVVGKAAITTGNVVGKAAITTGNVVGTVGGAAISSAAAGLSNIRKVNNGSEPRAVPGGIDGDAAARLSWERKLQERQTSMSPNRSPEVSASVPRSPSSLSAPVSAAATPSRSSSPERKPSRGRPAAANSGDGSSTRTTNSLSSSPTRSEKSSSSPTTAAVPALPFRPPTDTQRQQQQPPPKPARPNKISAVEIETILECLFGTIEEVFHLSDPNQWIRQKGLHVVKSVLRRTHGATIASSLQKWFQEARSTTSVSGYINSATDSMWPDGIWHADAAATITDASVGVIARSEEDRADTRREAKRLLLRCSGLLGLDGLERVLGRYNTVMGLTRLFNMLQHRELNQGLVCAVLEALVLAALVES